MTRAATVELKHLDVLIVEDEPVVAMALAATVSDLGHRVVASVAKGEDALELVQKELPDLVLMDIQLAGELDGIETSKLLRDRWELPSIFLSGYSDDETFERAKQASPHAYLNKPFGTRELSRAIDLALRGHHLERQVRDQERWRAAVMRSLGEAVFVTDLRGHITYVNALAESYLQERASDLEGTALSEWLGPETTGLLLDSLGRSAPGVQQRLIELTRPGGHRLSLECRSSPLLGPDRSPRGRVIACLDVTARRKSEQKLKLSDQILSRVGNLVLVADRSGQVIYASPSVSRILGYEPAEVLGEGWLQRTRRDQDEIREEVVYLSEAATRKRSVIAEPYERCVVARDGDERWILWRDTLGPNDTIIGIGTDVTARRQAIDRLRESEQRFALASQGTQDGLWDWDLDSGRIFLSPQWCSIVGEPAVLGENALPETWLDRIHPASRTRVQAALQEHLEGRLPQFEDQHRIRHHDGSYRWVLARGMVQRDAEGTARRVAGFLSDVTDRELTDRLTGLPNRNRILEQMRRIATRVAPGQTPPMQLLCIDLDRFKLLNESLGFQAGDEVLVEFSGRLRESIALAELEGVATLARLEADEFAILLEAAEDQSGGIRLADLIRERLQEPFDAGPEPVLLSASIGIAFAGETHRRAERVLRSAEAAMHGAKAKGGGQYEIFEAAMHSRAVRRWNLERKLRTALAAAELHLNFQPIVSLDDGSVKRFESLSRWRLPSGENVSPAEFVEVAEETGLIHQLGDWSLRSSCLALRSWRKRGFVKNGLGISVNLSPREMRGDLVERVQGVLEATGIEPPALTLEITEGVLIEQSDRVIEILSRLRSLGIQLALDDFGTGFSSLSILHRLPVTCVKIDRAFVKTIDAQSRSKLVDSIVLLARNVGLEIVAEGVETEDQLGQLTELGCDYAQGYLLSPPVDNEAAEQLVGRRFTKGRHRPSAVPAGSSGDPDPM